MKLPPDIGNNGTPFSQRDAFDRVSDIVKSGILGMAAGTGLASGFSRSLTSVVIGAVLGCVVNAVLAWIYPPDWRDRAAVTAK